MKNKSIFLSLLLLVLLFPIQVFAAGKIDVNKPVSLTIHYENEGVKLENVEFDIYQIATVNEYGEYFTTSQFETFNVNITGENDEAWKTLASTLVGYVLRDSIVPSNTGITNKEGFVEFNNIKQGLYLVVGDTDVQDGYIYEVDPFIVQVPNVINNEWNYDVAAYPKNQSREEEKLDLNVIKNWHDKGFEKQRPTEIIVQLLCNGEVFDTVTLNKENNWRYSWKGLDPKATWHVVEKEYIEYSVIVEKKGNTFLIHNTYIYDVPPPPPLDDTGVLWWPVPVLLIGGSFFILIGLLMNKKNEENHEI